MGCRLFLDEDASDWDLVSALKSRRIDVISAVEARLIQASDEQQLKWSTTQGRVICTFNAKHFHSLHAQFMSAGESHSGIIIGKQRQFSIGEQMRRLVRILNSLTPEELRNRLEYLSNWH